jgi:hypothetical protein
MEAMGIGMDRRRAQTTGYDGKHGIEKVRFCDKKNEIIDL